MRKIDLICVIVVTGLFASSIGPVDASGPVPAKEVVHSIFEFDFEYQERARSVVAEMMSHMGDDTYVRWRPIRIEPREILQAKIIGYSAMPESLQLTVFPDTIVSAQRTRYTFREATGNAIWEGVIPGFENSRVEITIVDMTDRFAKTDERIAFVIRIWDPPRQYAILPTDDLDIYVAVEVRVPDDTDTQWAPYH